MVKVVFDAGHGGHDSGAVGNGIREKDIVLQVVKEMEKISKGYDNLQVKLTRSGDTFLTLSERARIANAFNADLFISVHINAGGGVGYEDFIYTNVTNETRKAQRLINKHVSPLFTRNRGRKSTNFQVLRDTRMSAVLTENGFIDNKSDASKLKDSKFIKSIAEAHVKAIVEMYNLKKSGNNKKQNPSKQKYIEVITHSLHTYNTANFADRSGTITHKGDVFTVKKDKFKVGNGHMYQLKSGLYISANPQYVKEFTK